MHVFLWKIIITIEKISNFLHLLFFLEIAQKSSFSNPFPSSKPPLNWEMEECAHMSNNTQVHYCLRGCMQCAQVGQNFCQSLKLDLFYKLGLKFVLMGHLATNDVFLSPWHPLYSFLSCNITKHLDLQERHALLFDV